MTRSQEGGTLGSVPTSACEARIWMGSWHIGADGTERPIETTQSRDPGGYQPVKVEHCLGHTAARHQDRRHDEEARRLHDAGLVVEVADLVAVLRRRHGGARELAHDGGLVGLEDAALALPEVD